MPEELKAILADRPHLQTIYFNEKGEWLFHSHPHFPKAVSRQELLKEPDKSKEAAPADKDVPVTKTVNNKKNK